LHNKESTRTYHKKGEFGRVGHVGARRAIIVVCWSEGVLQLEGPQPAKHCCCDDHAGQDRAPDDSCGGVKDSLPGQRQLLGSCVFGGLVAGAPLQIDVTGNKSSASTRRSPPTYATGAIEPRAHAGDPGAGGMDILRADEGAVNS